MGGLLGSVILSDNHVLGLENRAFREGALGADDFYLSEFCEPRVSPATVREGTALDLVCLYDSVLSDHKRFDLCKLNALAGEEVIGKRPDAVRDFSLGYRVIYTRARGEKFTLAHQMGDGELDEFVAAAAHEAQYLLRRDVAWYLDDAKESFESTVTLTPYADPYAVEVSHAAAKSFLRANIFWLVDVFEVQFAQGSYNHLVDADFIEDCGIPRELCRQFRYLMRSPRFETYFNHLQEAYANLYDSSFLGRIGYIELAYERAPDRRAPEGPDVDVAAASRILRVNLCDVVEYLPLPRTVEESFELRVHPRVVAFRHALDRWLSVVSSEPEFEARVRRDLELANRDLRILKHVKSIKQNPIVFGIRTVIGLVPVAGSIITAVDAVEYFYERRVEKRSAWVVTPRGPLD